MKILALLALLASAPVLAAEPVTVAQTPQGGLVITLSPEYIAYCGTQGGCRIVTGAELEGFAMQVAAEACGIPALNSR